MSLDSAGVSIELLTAAVGDISGERIGYGFDNRDPANALRLAIEEFIESDNFKQLTTTSCYNSMDMRVEFLLHTKMPR